MYRHLLTNRNFVALWIGQAVSSIGDYFTMLAIPIYVNRLTDSVMLVGLSFIFTALPALVLGPVAGVFVDRLDRRKVMIASDLLRGLLSLCLLLVNDASQVWLLYLIGFLISCLGQFFNPARAAVLPLIVPDQKDWLAANGLMRILQTVGMLGGPALAGLTISAWGEKIAFIADSASFFISALAIVVMAVPFTASSEALKPVSMRSVWADLCEGVAYMLNNQVTLGVLISLSVASIGFSTVNMIWIPYLQRVYGVGAAGLGMADATLGAGMLISGMLLGQAARRVNRTVMSSLGLAFIGVTYLTIIFLPSFAWILVWQFLAGLALTPLQSALDTMLQVAVPDLKRGRVNSSMNAVTTFAGLISMMLASLFGEAVGLRLVFVILGCFVLVSGLIGFKLLRETPQPVENSGA